MAPFGLILPARIRFGRGEALACAPEILGLGRRIVLVHGRSPGRSAPLAKALEAAGAVLHRETCGAEPDLDMLTAALARARGFGPEAVVAMGGGAALDFGKALAALLPAPDPDPLEHLEVVGKGLPLHVDPLPFVALPTTAGTGSEVTRNAVIGVPEHRRKVSLRDPRMMARLAVIDPGLSDGAPLDVTMASGLDAVTQVIEPYLSSRANPFTDALCRDAIPRGLAGLARLAQVGEDRGARDALSLVACQSGIALANAGLGAVHGVAGVLGGETGAAHGAICGQLLPPVLRLLRRRAAPGSVTAVRLAEVDGWCLKALGCGIDGLAGWARGAGLPLPEARLSAEQARAIAENSATSSSMKASPIGLTAEELTEALTEAGWT
ncbi:iron-containing alcohol dehydrogenase [Maliponia aquimaris]|uniref:iron-containing alcohol dehydrogenase n=1 Tax=Maliponia aquimaris TaxID=1673631 RepID=UPI000B8AA14E|nr:iron-containing alcohol dehydrogenase [Maliponia aquimaris]